MGRRSGATDKQISSGLPRAGDGGISTEFSGAVVLFVMVILGELFVNVFFVVERSDLDLSMRSF